MLLILPSVLIGWTACVGAAKKPTVTPEQGLQALTDGCRPVRGAPEWLCTEAAYIEAGLAIIDTKSALKNATDELEYLRQDCALDREACEARLDQWWRKWYIVLPLGALLGLVTGGVLYLFLGEARDGQELPGADRVVWSTSPWKELSPTMVGPIEVSG
uniref:Uncharacterized protein n=1 Tax=viral metagenome TaxID=1070528 RepID=A0A6M3XSR9_9ZZZZ